LQFYNSVWKYMFLPRITLSSTAEAITVEIENSV
jgi:hypothetical protein